MITTLMLLTYYYLLRYCIFFAELSQTIFVKFSNPNQLNIYYDIFLLFLLDWKIEKSRMI